MVQAAQGDTFFVDEVGEIPLEKQSNPLRVLQEGDYFRGRADTTRKVNNMGIAATNWN